jgi:hypothetical protein
MKAIIAKARSTPHPVDISMTGTRRLLRVIYRTSLAFNSSMYAAIFALFDREFAASTIAKNIKLACADASLPI